jgi:predicted phosphodiesterase
LSRICVFGDVHSSIPAFEAVLSQAGDCDAFWCVGDIVGYGPSPNESVERAEEIGAVSVAGNHDLGSLGKINLFDFNVHARLACEWTGRNLEEKTRGYLESLPLRQGTMPGCIVVHGSPREPVWEYILSSREAAMNFAESNESVCFHGHSHAPAVFYLDSERQVDLIIPGDGTEVELEERFRYLINVGSVGQPRDGDPRACYVIYEPERAVVCYHRVQYPIIEVQEKMAEVGLPALLIKRLAFGR